MADIHRKLTSWMKLMDEYEFEIRHLPGDKNVIADYLSRSVALVPTSASVMKL